MSNKTEIRDRHYLKYLKKIRKTYEESKDWNKVISTAVYSDVDQSLEAFIDYVEEVYKTKVKDAKHLNKLIGGGDIEVLEAVIISSRHSKYFRALETALQEGATYPELLKIKPKEFGLPEKWNKALGPGSDQYSTILWALSSSYLIGSPSLMLLPSLRAIAEEIKAPYSVLMDAYKLTN